MKIINVAVRLLIVAVVAIATYHHIQEDPAWWVTFTAQSNLMVAAVMLWAVYSLLFDKAAPPAWLQGMVTLFLLITGLVYALVLGYPDPLPEPVLFGLANTFLHHAITPVLTLVVWLFFVPHRQLKWKYSLMWLSYFYAYLIFALTRAAINPEAGYPYPFIDLDVLGWGGLLQNVAFYTVLFAAMGAILIAVDKVLPAVSTGNAETAPGQDLAEGLPEELPTSSGAAE